MADRTWRFNYRDIERLTSALKLALFRDVLDLFGDQAVAIDALQSGKYQLSLEKFESVLENFKPSPKELIINDLVDWEKSVQSVVDFAETDLASLYDCERPVAAKPARAAAPSVQEEPQAEEPQPEEVVPLRTEPVYPLSDAFTVDPLLGVADIRFAIGARPATDVKVVINSTLVVPEADGDNYHFVFEPDEDDSEVDVFVRDAGGYIGSFTAVIKKAIAANKDFDI